MQSMKLMMVTLMFFSLCACAGADVKNISGASNRIAADFTLSDHDGKFWKLSDTLKDYKAVVLAFYPKDDTGV